MALSSSLIIGGAVLFLLIVFVLVSYVKAPPSAAYIISGLSKEPRVLIGKGGFKFPYLERLDSVYLGQITVDIKTDSPVPTNDFINVDVDAVSKIRVKPTPEGIRLAAKNFLNMSASDISTQVQDSLEGNLREIIGTLDLTKLNTDRDGFSDEVTKKASPDMEKLGIEILSCNIQKITDSQGLIKDLGADNTAKIKKNAAITKALADKEVEIETAKAKQEANLVKVEAETKIAEQNNELAIRIANLQKQADTEKAIADAAYEIQKQEQQKLININTVNAEIEKTKRQQTLSEEKIKIKENVLAAEVKKQAEADRYKTETDAQAALELRKRQAESDAYEVEQKAKAEAYEAEQKAKAVKAEADAKRYLMEQEALGIKAKGEADAFAIQQKGIAEAEALEKKAEAYEKFGQAAIMDMIVKILPDMAKNVAEPISVIDSVNIYDGGIDKVSGNVPAVIKQTFDTVKSVTGVDMSEVLKSQTISAKTDRNINLSGETVETTKELLND
jgi:flotillin